MTSSHTMQRGAVIMLTTNVIEKVIVFANVFIILSYLSVYEYGLTELVFSVLSLVGIIMLPGIASTIIADMGVARAKDERGYMKMLFHQYTYFLTGVSLIAFLTLFLGATLLAQFSGNILIAHFLQIMSLSLLITPLRSISLLIATVHVRFFDQAVYPIVEELVKMGSMITFFFFFHLGPLGLLYAIVLSQCLGVLVFLPRTLSGYFYFSQAHAEGKHRFWEILSTHRKWSVASSYVGTFTQNAQVWIIKALLGTEAVGLYAFATGIMSNISSLIPFTDVFTSLGPKYIEKKDELIALVRNSVRMQLLATLVLIAGAISLLPVLVYFIPKYKPALLLTILMLLVVIPTSVTAVFTPTFALFKEQFEFLKTVCVKLILTITIVPLSVLAFGLPGIGIASITLNTASGFERYVRLKRIFQGFSLEFSTLLRITKSDIAFIRKLAGKALSRDVFARLLIETKGFPSR